MRVSKGAAVRRGAVLEQEDALPSAELQPSEKGFAAAKLDDIARKAGISKATLYLYFDTKEEIFRAVAQSAVASLLEALESQSEGTDAPFAELAPKLLLRAAEMMKGGRVPAIARMVIGESRTFPDLARIWHDDVV